MYSVILLKKKSSVWGICGHVNEYMVFCKGTVNGVETIHYNNELIHDKGGGDGKEISLFTLQLRFLTVYDRQNCIQ